MDTKASQKQLIGLITEHLSESIPVTRILTYKPDKSGAVTGRFESLNRVYNFVFKGEDVRYKPAGSMDSALFSDYYLERFDAAPVVVKGTRALPKCTSQSYSCKGQKGVACITLTKSCKIDPDAIGRERLNKIKKLSSDLADAVMFDFEPDPTNQKKLADLEKNQAKIVEKRMALAAEKRLKRIKAKEESSEKNKTQGIVKQKKSSQINKEQTTSELKKAIKEWGNYYKKPVPAELNDNKTVHDWMVNNYIKNTEVGEKHIAIVGENGKTQSALVYSASAENGVYVRYLLTAPWNVVKGDSNAEKGSGAKAVLEAIKKSKELGYEGKITLDALEGAEAFYKHLGFQYRKDKEEEGNYYELSPENAQKLLKKYGQ
jgi:hypothetical protein